MEEGTFEFSKSSGSSDCPGSEAMQKAHLWVIDQMACASA